MTKPAQPRRSGRSVPQDLSAQAHDQIMDYLRLAEASSNEAITSAAVELAKERQRQHQKVDAKISPQLAVILATVIAVGAASACWYALVSHPDRLGFELVIVIVIIAIVVISVYALFSGHLSQTNFMAVIHWAGGCLKSLNPLKTATAPEITAAADDKTPKAG